MLQLIRVTRNGRQSVIVETPKTPLISIGQPLPWFWMYLYEGDRLECVTKPEGEAPYPYLPPTTVEAPY